MAPRKLSLTAIRRALRALPEVDEETRDRLLQADPSTFFIAAHYYLGHPMVLARLVTKLVVRTIEVANRNKCAPLRG